jgi:hypothetical protein
LPGQQHQSAAGAQRSVDVRERGDGVTEEHRPGSADGSIEVLGVERVDLRVGLLEAGVGEALVSGAAAGDVDHLR